MYKHQKILQDLGIEATDDVLHPKWKEAYANFHALSEQGESTEVLNQLDDDLVNLFESLHDVEGIEDPENESSDPKKKIDDESLAKAIDFNKKAKESLANLKQKQAEEAKRKEEEEKKKDQEQQEQEKKKQQEQEKKKQAQGKKAEIMRTLITNEGQLLEYEQLESWGFDPNDLPIEIEGVRLTKPLLLLNARVGEIPDEVRQKYAASTSESNTDE